jgi:ATP-dependent Clp protease protease subunit
MSFYSTMLLSFCFGAFCLGLSPLVIELNKNFASLRDTIDSNSATQVIYNLNELNTSLSPIYLYINSPGGDVMAGMEIINYMKGLQAQNRKINCIAFNAMSMAFVIFQYCSERYILHSSTLMQHQMSLSGISGKLYDINSRMTYYNTIEKELNAHQADRLKISSEAFIGKIQHDWWLHTQDILSQNGADKIVTIKCTFENYFENVTVSTLFGDITMVYSACPIISQPLKVLFSQLYPLDQRSEFLKNRSEKLNLKLKTS